MGSAAVRGHRWGTGPHDRAEVAAETLVRDGRVNSRIVSRLEFTLYRVLAVPDGPCNQNVRPAR
jgi:hypothetical protein